MSFTAAGVMAEALDMGTGSSATYPTKWVIDPRVVGCPSCVRCPPGR